LTLYRHSSGALVFGAGTVAWSWALDGTHDTMVSVPDANIQQATVNILADMGALPGSPRPGLVVSSGGADTVRPASVIVSPANGASVPNGSPITITGTASDTGGQVAGVEVSVDGGATCRAAVGTTAWTFNWTPVALGNVTIKSRAVDDSGNLEAPAAGSTVAISGVIRVSFDELTPVNRVLNGQYPAGLIDWGTGQWFLASPWQAFTTNSIGFNGAGPTSKTFRLLMPLTLQQVSAYNGANAATTVTVACSGLPTASLVVNARQLATVPTGWTTPCAGLVTLGSSNGWDTNFDTLLFN
jgi:hypothetical protein